MARPSRRVKAAAVDIGENLTTWRKLQRLTAAQVADRAGISRNTLRKIESGDFSVGLESFLAVSRALGVMKRVVTATDPYETDVGRLRADQALPQRVRR